MPLGLLVFDYSLINIGSKKSGKHTQALVGWANDPFPKGGHLEKLWLGARLEVPGEEQDLGKAWASLCGAQVFRASLRTTPGRTEALAVLREILRNRMDSSLAPHL